MPLSLGTARAAPGKIKYGAWDFVAHPSGGRDRLPVIIAQGDPRGPVLWVTASIHGPEHTGILVVHQLINRELVRKLHGTIVALPTLNPAGVRTLKRQPYYHDGDPNRAFPDGRPAHKPDPDDEPPSSTEQAYARLLKEIKASADCMVDLHNWSGSLSYVFKDTVFYRSDRSAAQNKAARAGARRMDARLAEMCAAYGHTTINELPARKYLAEKLHRSTTSAAVNVARLPALTMELGDGNFPDSAMVRAATAGLRNLMRWAGMLADPPEPITGIRIIDPGYPCRRMETPRVSTACIVRHLVEAGEIVERGQPLAEIRDIWGRPTGEKILRSEHDGWIMARSAGVAFYPGAAVCTMAVHSSLDTVQPYPKDFFKRG